MWLNFGIKRYIKIESKNPPFFKLKNMSIPSPDEIIARANDVINEKIAREKVDKKKEYNINLCKKLTRELQNEIVSYPTIPEFWNVHQVKKKEDFLIYIRCMHSYNDEYSKMKAEAREYYDEVEVKKILTDAGYTVTTRMFGPIISGCCFPTTLLPSLERYVISLKKEDTITLPVGDDSPSATASSVEENLSTSH